MSITWKTILISLAAVLFVTGTLLFGLGDIGLFFKLRYPFNRNWQAVHLSNDKIFYGHISAMNWKILELKDAYFLEVFRKASSTASIYDNSNSETFDVGGSVSQQTKQVLTKQPNTVYLSWPSVTYWEDVSPAEEIFKYLQ